MVALRSVVATYIKTLPLHSKDLESDHIFYLAPGEKIEGEMIARYGNTLQIGGISVSGKQSLRNTGSFIAAILKL